MSLHPGEEILGESDPLGFVLTTHRVRWETGATGGGQLVGIMLNELVSCSIAWASKPILLVFAALSAIMGVIVGSQAGSTEAVVGGFLVGAAFVVVYALTRSQVIELASARAVVRLSTKGMALESARKLVDDVEAAKHRYGFIVLGHGPSVGS